MGNKNKKGRSLFFMGKWKQGIALFLSVILSITSVFTWNSTIRVHAEEAVIKSSAEGFEYRLRTYASGSTVTSVRQIQRRFTITIRMQSKELLKLPKRL